MAFNRRLRITIGPLNGANGRIATFESNGTRNSLKADVTINTSIMGVPQPSTIAITNLSKETRNGIRRGLTKITVEAGWQDTGLSMVFNGEVLAINQAVSGTEIVTTLSCLAGYGALSLSVVSFSFPEGTALPTVIQSVCKKFDGITLNKNSIQYLESQKLGRCGYAYAGSAMKCLNDLAELYGFSWNIENNILTVLKDGKYSGASVKVAGNGGGLISVQPILNGAYQIQTGIKGEVFWTQGLKAGAPLNVNSHYSPELNGEYIIHKLQANLTTFSDTWKASFECYKNL